VLRLACASTNATISSPRAPARGRPRAAPLLVLLALLAGAPEASGWTRQLDGTGQSAGIYDDGDRVADVAFDGAGDVIWTGRLKQAATGYDVVVEKLAGATGTPLWRYDLAAGDFAEPDAGAAIGVDAARDVYVAARVYDDVRKSGIELIKLDGATGAELWRVRADGANDLGLEFPTDLGIAQGDVFVVGRLSDPVEITQLAVLRFDGATGAELWRREVDSGTNGDDQAHALAFLANGDLVVAGRLDVADRDFAVLAFDADDGSDLWSFVLDGTAGFDADEAVAVAVGPGSQIVSAGYVSQATGAAEQMAAIRLDPLTGGVVWDTLIEGAAAELARANAVAIDAAGDVVLGGTIGSGSSTHFAVVKLDGGNGAEDWRELRSGGSGNSLILQVANDVAVDAAGDVVAVGTVGEDASSFDPELNVLKLAGATGSELWRVRRSGSQDESNAGGVVALDPAGSVLAGGFLSELGSEEDATVLRLDGALGADFAVPALPAWGALALAVGTGAAAIRRLRRRAAASA